MKYTKLLLGIFVVFTLVLSACSVLDVPNVVSNPPLDSNTEFTSSGDLKSFNSIEEIDDFLDRTSTTSYYGGGVVRTLSTKSVAVSESASMDMDSSDSISAGNSAAPNVDEGSDYSETNNQVEGVDEADIVKTDGDFIYYLSSGMIHIIKADDTEVLSEIQDDYFSPSEMYINGDKLIVIGWESPKEPSDSEMKMMASSIMPYPYYRGQTSIRIYDISDKEDVELDENIKLDSSYYSSRMIDDKVYVILNEYMYAPFIPPVIRTLNNEYSIKATDIKYFDQDDENYQLSTILAIDLTDNSFEDESIVKGYSQDIFVSKDNIYLTNQKYIPYYVEQKRILEEVLMKKLPSDVVSEIKKIQDYDIRESTKMNEIDYIVEKYYYTLSEEERQALEKELSSEAEKISNEVAKEREKTVINKISLSDLEFVGKAEVKGNVLNQFSMDEFDGYFRIATTTGNSWDEKNPNQNHLFVFDSDLKEVGSIEDIAPGERIYSVRFMGNRAYMVTFKNVDPLFVLNLSDPENPTILGKLKIPGFSNYLHPFDENHIIGIGKATEEDSKNDRFYLEGLKMSLFDVTDVEHPKEMYNVEIGDRGTDSDALYNHKAFLFDREKELLVIPIRVAEIDPEKYNDDEEKLRWAYGDYTFQGAYVYKLNLDGFDLKGRITHFDQEDFDKSGYNLWGPKTINRALYIGDTLYTLSESKVQANSLDDLSFVSSTELKTYDYPDEPVYYAADVDMME